MAKRYFIDTNPLYRKVAGMEAEIYAVDNGNPCGLLVAETDDVAVAILAAGGTEEINEEQYQERLKKKAALTSRKPSPLSVPPPRKEIKLPVLGQGNAVVVENGALAAENNPGANATAGTVNAVLENLTAVIVEPKSEAKPRVKKSIKSKDE